MKKVMYLYFVVFLIPFFGNAQVKEGVITNERIIIPEYTEYLDKDCDGIGCDEFYDEVLHGGYCFSTTTGDCDDNNENVTSTSLWFLDNDHDGFGNPNITSCYYMTNYVSNDQDCNDSYASIYPRTWYADLDGDGFGNISNTIISCFCPPEYVDDNTDCNDADPRINPNTKWYFDPSGDVVFSDSEFYDEPAPVIQCTSPGPNYTTAYTSTLNKNFNWTHAASFDIMGNVTGASRTYFDELGKSNLSLSRDVVSGKIWGTETTYDAFGRPEKSSFPAPSSLTNFGKIGFLTTSTAYPSTTNLTNYYSNNNEENLYQATATQPYSQTNYDLLNPGNVINIVGGNRIGTDFKTGYSYTVPAAQEMYYVFGYNYYDGPVTAGKEEIITKFYKSVSVDANGIENVAFSDGEGKVLATARAGSTVPSVITPYPVHSLIGTQGYVDVHIPSGIPTAQITLIDGAALYDVYNLKDGLLVTVPLIGGNGYRVVAKTIPTTEPKMYVTNATPGVLSYPGAKGISYYVNYYDYAINVYDKTGRLLKNIQPNGFRAVYAASPATFTITAAPAYLASTNFASTYTYNTLGQVIATTSADQGTSTFAYKKDGQIRYSQSALQSNTKVSYTDYDTYGRPIESGVIANTWANAIVDPDAALITGTRTEQTFTIYDYPENNGTSVPLPTTPTNLTLAGVLGSGGMGLSAVYISANYTQKNLSGNVAITYTKPDANITAISWYSYDLYGRAEWVVQYNEGIGAKTIHYYYDYKGNVKNVVYQKDKTTELFAHRYTYDANDVLKKVETATNIAAPNYITHADYSYYLSGELKRVNIAQGAQGLDYVYTLGGALKSINHPSLEAAKDPGGDTNDVFGITLDYYSGDYLRTGRNIATSPNVTGTNQDFNGNIKAATWANKQLDVPNPSLPASATNLATKKSYLYNYNRNNWLNDATYGSITNSGNPTMAITPSANYKEGGLTYDANGNITKLQRANNAATTVDDLTYNYTYAGKNQLNSVTDGVINTTYPNDIDNGQLAGNYVYDVLGQMTRNIQENLYYYYNTQGLVTQVNKGTNPVVKFYYNERGQRIKKESFNTLSPYQIQSTDYYVLDLSGNVLSIYNKIGSFGVIAQKELPIYGLTRLGVYGKGSPDFMTYQIADHLGNVRAVIKKPVGGSIVTPNLSADYYPFGEQLPDRNTITGNYRYAFQGQELDTETNMEAFQLRLWDGRIGRWLSPDPKHMDASPYIGMANNPTNTIDPDGGCPCSQCPENCQGSGVNPITDADNMYPNTSGMQYLNEIVINGASKSSNGFYGSGLSGYSTPGSWGMAGYNFGGNYSNSGGFDSSFNVSGFKADFGNYSSDAYLDLRAKVSGIEANASVSYGNKFFSQSLSASGAVFSAEANLNGASLTGQDGKYGVKFGFDLGAYTAKGDITGGANILGATFEYTIGGSVLSAHTGGHAHTYWNNKTGSLEISGMEHLGLGIGKLAGINVSLPLRAYYNFFLK